MYWCIYAFKIYLELIMNGNSIHASEAYMFMQIPKHFHLPGLSIKKKSYIIMSRYTHLSSYILCMMLFLSNIYWTIQKLNYLIHFTRYWWFFLYPLLWKVLVYSSRITLFVDLVINSISCVYVYTFTTTFIVFLKSTLGV